MVEADIGLIKRICIFTQQNDSMKALVTDKILSVEEYIEHELKAERRSEYINGQLFEMPGEKDINNELALQIFLLLTSQLKPKGYFLYVNDIKVAIPGEKKFFYPDVFVTREQKTENNQYIKYAPELLAEIVSPGSHSHDYIDKYIEYTKIPSLQYYLIVEPETILITMYARSEEGWEVQKFTKLSDEISLPALGASFLLQDIYAI
jgi:Uma2 family endonuclease